MRITRIAAAVLVLGLSNVALAQGGLSLGIDGGAVKHDEGPTGFGLNVYPGFTTALGIIPELNLGLSYAQETFGPKGVDFTVSNLILPIYVGARFAPTFGALVPFVGAHVGLAAIRAGASGGFGGDDLGFRVEGEGSDWFTRLGFNTGAGLDYLVSDDVGVGVAFWYGFVNGEQTKNENDLSTYTFAADVRYNLF